MKIVEDLLRNDDGSPLAFKASPNRGGSFAHGLPDTLVVHFTAGRSAESSVRWLTDKRAKASAHVVIGEDGAITQLVPFNVVAWHAGTSKWKAREGLNRYSIGIELDNPGDLRRTGSKWRTWFGEEVDENLVLITPHKHGGPDRGWKIYPPAQLEAAIELGALLVETYGLKEVVGHDDIAPGRKKDPGPAFPMTRFRGLLFGRAEESGPLSDAAEEL
jgi:N-acetylmuramoyl-L-alanine amidase